MFTRSISAAGRSTRARRFRTRLPTTSAAPSRRAKRRFPGRGGPAGPPCRWDARATQRRWMSRYTPARSAGIASIGEEPVVTNNVRLGVWALSQKRHDEELLENLMSGKVRISEDDGSGRMIDVTQQAIDNLKASIATLNEILAEDGAGNRSMPLAIPVDQLNASNDE